MNKHAAVSRNHHTWCAGLLFHCRQVQGCEFAFVKWNTAIVQCRIVACIFDLMLDATVVEKSLKIADIVLAAILADDLDHETIRGSSDRKCAVLVFGKAVVW